MAWLDDVKWGRDGLVPVVTQEASSGDVLMVAHMNREALAATAERGEAVYWSRSRARLWHKGEASGHVQKVQQIRLDCDGDVVLLAVTQLGHDPGIACHTGRHSCFFQRLDGATWRTVEPVLKDPQAIYHGGAPATQPSQGALDDTVTGPAGAPPGASRHADAGAEAAAAAGHLDTSDVLARLAAIIDARQPARGGDPAHSYVARLFSKGPDAILKKIGEEATEVVMAAKDVAHGADPAQLVREMADLWFHSMIALSAHGLQPAHVLQELQRREGVSGLEEFALRKAQQREDAGA